ncbi:MAG: permease-like cell division protein FtsX [Pseudomonadota bacterium]
MRAYAEIHLQSALTVWTRLVRMRQINLLTTLVIGLTLSLPTALYVLSDNVQRLLPDWRNDTQVSVFFRMDTPSERARAQIDAWARRPGVAGTEMILPEAALAELRTLPGFDAAIGALDTNPLPIVAVLRPRSARDADLDALIGELQQSPIVERVQLDREWLERLQAVAAVVGRLARLMGLLFALAVMMVIGHAIRMEVHSRRSEIEITKLVGGTDAFIQRPFLYTGLAYGLFGALMAWVVVQVAVWIMSGPVARLAALYQTEARLHGLGFADTALLILIGMGLGGIGAFGAVRRQIRRIEPT